MRRAALLLSVIGLLIRIVRPTPTQTERKIDYCVIGAGPAGLQMGYFLQRAGRDYVIFERANISGMYIYYHYYNRTSKQSNLLSVNVRIISSINTMKNKLICSIVSLSCRMYKNKNK